MKKHTFAAPIAVLLLITITCSGCGSLSLFSSRHVHYHGGPEADKKIQEIEKRIETLEKSAQEQTKK